MTIQCTVPTTQPVPIALYQRSSLEALDGAACDHCPMLKNSHQLPPTDNPIVNMMTNPLPFSQYPNGPIHSAPTCSLVAHIFLQCCKELCNKFDILLAKHDTLIAIITKMTDKLDHIIDTLDHLMIAKPSIPLPSWHIWVQCHQSPICTTLPLLPALLTLKLLTTLKHACFHQTLLPWHESLLTTFNCHKQLWSSYSAPTSPSNVWQNFHYHHQWNLIYIPSILFLTLCQLLFKCESFVELWPYLVITL